MKIRIAILVCLLLLSSQAAYGQTEFQYDPANGAFSVIPSAGESIWSINVATLADALTTELPTAQWGFADLGDEVEWTDQFAGAFPLTNTFELGTFATGLNAGDFGRVLYFIAESFDDNTTTVTVIPEPASLVLIGLGGLAMATRRRRA